MAVYPALDATLELPCYLEIMLIPIVEHHRPSCSPGEVQRAEKLAEELAREYPWLQIGEGFRTLVPDRLDPAPALHLDDLSAIPMLNRYFDVGFMEDRARLRAGPGDLVASCTPADPCFEAYCQQQLNLGEVTWLRPRSTGDSRAVATAVWTDESVRQQVLKALAAGDLHYIHPHMGNFLVWALAAMLRRASGAPVQVIAPHPGLTRFVNDKTLFSHAAARLLGPDRIPTTRYAYNYATLARIVAWLAVEARHIVIKLPDSAGGAGNLLLEAERLRGMPLGDLRRLLRERLAELRWQRDRRLLVGCWESNVLSTPSSQLWIPPEGTGIPVVEGLYQQYVEGPEAFFVGCRPAVLAGALAQQLVDESWLLARLFQRLGYVGRCSFDAVVVGEAQARSRLEFVECNGRWGGTSTPMTLMNRWFGDWARQPYATREVAMPGMERLEFANLLAHFGNDLFDARQGTGRIIFYNPGALGARSGIDLLALGRTPEEAGRAVLEEFPARMRALVGRSSREADLLLPF